jgi:hypothetical protein
MSVRRCANKKCGHPLRVLRGMWISKLNGGLHCNGVLKLWHKPAERPPKQSLSAGQRGAKDVVE